MEAYRYLAKAYNTLMADVDYDAWALYINRLLDGKGLRIFEAACGTGNITGRLYDSGHDLIASDISPEMLEIAMSDSRRHGRDIVFIQQDMRHISSGKKFDAVISACDGVNYLEPNSLVGFFTAAYHILKENGQLLFDISSANKLLLMDGEVFYDDSDDATCVWHNHFEAQQNKLRMDVILFIKQGSLYEKLSEQHIQYAHDVSDVKQSLADVGFSHVDVYEAFTTNAVQKNSSRIQFVCRKD